MIITVGRLAFQDGIAHQREAGWPAPQTSQYLQLPHRSTVWSQRGLKGPLERDGRCVSIMPRVLGRRSITFTCYFDEHGEQASRGPLKVRRARGAHLGISFADFYHDVEMERV